MGIYHYLGIISIYLSKYTMIALHDVELIAAPLADARSRSFSVYRITPILFVFIVYICIRIAVFRHHWPFARKTMALARGRHRVRRTAAGNPAQTKMAHFLNPLKYRSPKIAHIIYRPKWTARAQSMPLPRKTHS